MCGRFVSMTDPEGLIRFFTVDDRKADDLPASYNVAPTQEVYGIAEHRGARHLVTFRWGLLPSWAKDRKMMARLINARAESVGTKPAFRTALQRRRCLIPADGFYEWHTPEGGDKTPHFVHDPGGRPLAFAGLWETWRDPDDTDAPLLRTTTIITTAASGTMTRLYHRMPVVLPPDRWDAWLDRDRTDGEQAEALLRDPIDALEHHPVSTDVNNVRNDRPDLIRPV